MDRLCKWHNKICLDYPPSVRTLGQLSGRFPENLCIMRDWRRGEDLYVHHGWIARSDGRGAWAACCKYPVGDRKQRHAADQKIINNIPKLGYHSIFRLTLIA